MSFVEASPSTMHTTMGNGTSRKAAARSSKPKDALKQSDAVSTFHMLKTASKLVNSRRQRGAARTQHVLEGWCVVKCGEGESGHA